MVAKVVVRRRRYARQGSFHVCPPHTTFAHSFCVTLGGRYGSSSSSAALTWSSIKARLPKKGDQILYVNPVGKVFVVPPPQPCCRSSNGSPIDNIVSDTAAQLLFDKENHISQLVVQTGAKQCVDICNPEATKSLNARDKLKVQSKIEVGLRAIACVCV
jgi:hypothetical protein